MILKVLYYRNSLLSYILVTCSYSFELHFGYKVVSC